MSDRKVFADSVTPLPDQGSAEHGLTVNAALPGGGKEVMSLLFSLSMPAGKQSDLEARVAKGEVVSLEELKKIYSPPASEAKKLATWLKSQGFKVTKIASDNSGVYADASIDQIEKTLAVKMVRVTKAGLTYPAAQNAPSLPSDMAQSVNAIIGLQPFRKAHKHFRFCPVTHGNRLDLIPPDATKKPSMSARRSNSTGSKAKKAPTKNIKNTPPYLVSEIKQAYGADLLSVTGKGQTIAILIDTVPNDADLKSFWQRNGVSTTIKQIEKINVKGGALQPPEGEETLDVEWASGIAPGAKIWIYATGTLQFVDLDLALDRILADLAGKPRMRQLSISLGLGERFMPKGEIAAQHQKLLRLSAAGVNIFVSSGDAGSNPDSSGHGSSGPLQVEYELSDPVVIGVGGTSFSLKAKGQVASETGWAGSGGGESVFFSRPPWQSGLGLPVGNGRNVPDVSLVADPNTGALVVLNGKAVQIGGTSWSAPVWAGFCALINEARAKAKKPPLPFLNPLIYPLTSCFRDILSGSNGNYQAAAGYDRVTGLGVPNVKALVQALTK